MMLSLNGRPADIDGFRYFLAEKLGKTCQELEGMSAIEYVEWQAYYKVKHAIEGMG